jgi:4-amino-4-deoxy-L-arabinose transferase-like glycosyltransferase
MVKGNTSSVGATIAILFLVALAVRVVALKQNYVISNDGSFYLKMAQLYSSGQYDHELFRQYPYYAVFPLLILPFHNLFGDWVLAGQWVSVICGALTVIPLYCLGREIFNEKIGLVSAIFYIICPDLVQYSAEVLRDIPFIFFYTTALWLAYKGIKDEKIGLLGLAGLFVALSASLRIEGLSALVSLPIYFFWHNIKKDISWRKGFTAFVVLLVSALCIMVFFSLVLREKGVKVSRSHISMAKNVLTLRTLSDQTSRNLEKEIERKRISPAGKEFFHLSRKYRLVLYLCEIFHETVRVFNILFFLFVLGVIKRREVRYRQDEFLLFPISAVLVLVYLIYLINTNYLSTRHVLVLVVPCLIWSGVGFVELKERVVRFIRKQDFPLKGSALQRVSLFLMVVICIPLLLMAWAPQRRDKLELKEIGLWLKKNGFEHSTIAAQEEFARLVFYADGVFVPLPNEVYEGIMRFAREKGVNLLVVNEKTIDRFSPHFLKMVSPDDLQRISIPGIKTLKYSTVVFHVKKSKGRE